jgi:molybdopterin converting factor small subunit
MEIAKFVLTAIGTFISVSGLFFAVFQFWVKKREEKDAAFQSSVRKELEDERRQSRDEILEERQERKDSVERLGRKIDELEHSIMDGVLTRIGGIEGELKGMRVLLQTIQRWFIDNTPAGGK